MSTFTPSDFFDLTNFEHRELFDDIEFVWESLLKLPTYFQHWSEWGHEKAIVDPRAYLVNPEQIFLAEGVIVEPGAFIQGPCILGEKTVVRHGAYIRGQVIAGKNCVIGHDTEVKSSILLNKAQAAHFAYVGDSILGNQVNLGAGTKCANFKLDHGNVQIRGKDSGMRKLGAILGDGCQIGCNAVLNPGTLMGKQVLCYPCVNVGGVIASHSKILPSAKARVIS